MRPALPSAFMWSSSEICSHTRQRNFAPRPTFGGSGGCPSPFLTAKLHLLLLPIHDRLDPRLLALLLGEPEGTDERHRRAAGGVGAADGARPEPGDHGLPVRSLGVEMADALLGLVAHPLAVVAHVLGEPLRPAPGPRVPILSRDSGLTGGRPANFGGISISAFVISTATGLRSEPWASSPRRWASRGIEPPPQNGSRTGGGFPPVERMISARARPENVLVVRVLPLDQLLDDVEEPVALLLRLFLGQVVRGIVHQRGEEHRPAGRQRPPRPPQMQRRGMPMADGLLPRGLLVDGIQR